MEGKPTGLEKKFGSGKQKVGTNLEWVERHFATGRKVSKLYAHCFTVMKNAVTSSMHHVSLMWNRYRNAKLLPMVSFMQLFSFFEIRWYVCEVRSWSHNISHIPNQQALVPRDSGTPSLSAKQAPVNPCAELSVAIHLS